MQINVWKVCRTVILLLPFRFKSCISLLGQDLQFPIGRTLAAERERVIAQMDAEWESEKWHNSESPAKNDAAAAAAEEEERLLF